MDIPTDEWLETGFLRHFRVSEHGDIVAIATGGRRR